MEYAHFKIQPFKEQDLMRYILSFFLIMTSLNGSQIATFTPPKGWKRVIESELPKSVKFMVVGEGKSYFPPSINLGLEEHKGTLREYLDLVKRINESQGTEWRDLNIFETKAGKASLSEIVMGTEWGEIRMMHLIFLKEGMCYILTAAAKKEEFSELLPLFYEAFRSFEIQDK
jgi:hypothetical protein